MKYTLRGVRFVVLVVLAIPVIFGVVILTAPAKVFSTQTTPEQEPTLVKAVMCESIQKYVPANEAVIFSIKLGRIYSFTEFDPVPERAVIYHRWYHKGKLISEKQLTVNPPRWSSFSSMQLRDADKGPWQVDVTDSDQKVFHTLRFSITD